MKKKNGDHEKLSGLMRELNPGPLTSLASDYTLHYTDKPIFQHYLRSICEVFTVPIYSVLNSIKKQPAITRPTFPQYN